MTLAEAFARKETPPASLRAAISAALARPRAPKQVDLARVASITPQNLSAWLAGRRKSLPQAKIEAMLAQLDLVIVPAPPIGPKHGPVTPSEAKRRERCNQRHPELRGRRCTLGLGSGYG